MNRLLCIASSLNAGGAETFMMKMYRKIDTSQYVIDFIVSEEEKGFYADEVQSYGGKIYYVPPRTRSFYKAFRQIVEIVHDGNYNSVLKLCSTPIGAVDLLAATIGGAKKRICRSCNASTVGGRFTKIKDSIFRLLVNAVTNVYIAPSDLAAEYMFGKSKVNDGKVIFLRNGIDLSMYSFSKEDRISYRKGIGLEGNLVVGHVGRFNKQKNHSYLIDIFEAIHRKVPSSKLVLVGNGILQSEIMNKVSIAGLTDEVIFLGLRDDVNRLLSAMDIMVFPSLFEGMPNAIIEAQAAGLPCVISDSITQEANVTGSVWFMPLSASPEVWASTTVEATKHNRSIYNAKMKEAGYDIGDVVSQFIDICF